MRQDIPETLVDQVTIIRPAPLRRPTLVPAQSRPAYTSSTADAEARSYSFHATSEQHAIKRPVPHDNQRHARGDAESSGVRQTAKMRRLRAEDIDLVERTTAALRAIEVTVDIAPPDIDEIPTEHLPITIVPGASSANGAAAPTPRRKPHRWPAVAAGWALVFVVLGGLFAATSTLTGHARDHQFTPHDTHLTGDVAGVAPTGPWDSSASAINVLGVGGGAGPGVQAPGTAGLPVQQATPVPHVAPTAPPAAPTTAPAPTGISPAPVSPWPPSNAFMAVPGHPGYAVAEPQPDNYYWAFGQCTWWAQHERPDENLTHMGNAQYWAGSAAARGYHTGGAPVAGATVVFQPGVQGAGGAGHVAHVIAVYPDGWFLVSEMNFFWNGGGWARVDFRYAHAGSGVSFIY